MHTAVVECASPIPSEERREWPRVRTAVQVELRPKGNDVPLRATTADLSAGGCYVEMLFPLEVGEGLNIVLWLGLAKVVTQGRVVTCHPQVGNGIQFVDMAPEDRDLLETFLEVAGDEVAH